MQKRAKRIAILVLAATLSAGMMTMTASAAGRVAKADEVTEVVTADSGITTGTLGANNGFQYSYDASAKTLTITGEDSGLVLTEVAEEAETIVLKDCKLIGSAYKLFYNLSNVKAIEFDEFDTSQITDMSAMFHGCSRLTDLDLSDFDTSAVTNMGGMFSGCSELTDLDLGSFDTAQVTHMADMFNDCSSLIGVDVSSFDTSNVTSMEFMFYRCSSLTDLELCNFDTSQVTSMSFMFYECSALESLDVSGFNTTQVTSMSQMFTACNALTDLDLGSFDTSQITDMSLLFHECNSLTSLDLSNFDTSKVTDMTLMFNNCSSLTSVDISSFDTSKISGNTIFLFENCRNLITIHTPKVMLEGQEIPLQATFYDSMQNRTTKITSAFCNKVLAKEGYKVVRKVEIVSDSRELTIDNTMQLQLNIDNEMQEIAENSSFIWSVDSEDVVTVSDTGLVKGIGMGTANVTCVNKENSAETASFEITIKIPFWDIRTKDWQYPFVVYAYENNLMSGKGEGKFDMNGKLTRSEFVTVLYSYIGKPEVTYEQNFSDVTADKWFADAVTWAKQNNVTAGNADGTFGVYNNINREQLVVMLYQFAKNAGVVTETPTADLSSYGDLNKLSNWATEALQWAVQNNVLGGKNVNGVNYLDPKGNTSRGECATMMMRYVELTK